MTPPALKSLCDLVEQRTGYPVVVTADDDQTTSIKMRSASKEAPVHSIQIHSKHQESATYLVALQLAGLLFKWADPAGIRDFVENPEKAEYVRRKLAQKVERKGTPAPNAAKYSDMLVTGLLQQLNSTPLEILSGRWFFNEYPRYREEQARYVSAYLRGTSEVLAPKVREMCPEEIYSKSFAINAAYAAAWCDLVGSKVALIPYEAVGALTQGRKLVSLLDGIEPFSPTAYSGAVDTWGVELGMSDWYRWNLRPS